MNDLNEVKDLVEEVAPRAVDVSPEDFPDSYGPWDLLKAVPYTRVDGSLSRISIWGRPCEHKKGCSESVFVAGGVFPYGQKEQTKCHLHKRQKLTPFKKTISPTVLSTMEKVGFDPEFVASMWAIHDQLEAKRWSKNKQKDSATCNTECNVAHVAVCT